MKTPVPVCTGPTGLLQVHDNCYAACRSLIPCRPDQCGLADTIAMYARWKARDPLPLGRRVTRTSDATRHTWGH